MTKNRWCSLQRATSRCGAAALGLLAWLVCPVALADSAPDWLRAQIGAPIPAHDDQALAVELYSEQLTTFTANGKIRQTERKAYRILRPGADRYALVSEVATAWRRVVDLHGWSIPGDGKPYEVKDREAVEVSLDTEGGELVSDLRVRVLHLPAVAPGTVVGYEIQTEEQPLVSVNEWTFQEEVPAREAHYTLELPAGWQYQAVWLNHPEVAPVATGPNRFSWTVSGIEGVPHEPAMPPWGALLGRMQVQVTPPSGHVPGIQTWHDMGTWYAQLTQGRREASPDIKRKTQELTANLPDALAKTRALAAFVQSEVRYVAIELGIGGYQPHPASEVFAHRYGDCKDKVTLLGAMLHEAGIDSDYVIVNTARGAVQPNTPANLDFDHMIIAIHLPATVSDPALIALLKHPGLGTLLIFDPTDPYTPLGSLSGPLQGGYGLLVGSGGGELVQLPQLPASHDTLKRTAHMRLDEAGTLEGEVSEVFTGDRAASQRARLAVTTNADHTKQVESHIGHAFSRFAILKATVTAAHANDLPLEWRYELQVDRYAKSSGNLLIVRPRILGSETSGALESPDKRHHPFEFDALGSDSDDFEIELPPGYQVDDLPAPVNIEYDFAAYHSRTESAGGKLHYVRSFEVRQLSVPAADTPKLRDLYRAVDTDEHAAAVLKRAGG